MRTTGARGGGFAAAPVVLALALAACGSSAPALKAPCQANARAAVARTLGVKTVSAKESTGSNGSPQCTYAAGGRSVVANINVTPQAYFIVERTAVEASQQFAPIPAAKLPVQVDHVGLEAFWYPAFDQFETTDGVRVIQVTVTVPGASRARLIAIGKAAATPYLGKLHPPP
jgi:hypothetical protein